VWVKNPYPLVHNDEKGASERYREEWLPSRLASRPIWVPAEVTSLGTDSHALNSSLITVETTLPPRLPLHVHPKDILPMNATTGLPDLTYLTYVYVKIYLSDYIKISCSLILTHLFPSQLFLL